MYSEHFGERYELKGCVLKDVDSEKTLLVFDARVVTSPVNSAGFVGTGIASASQNYQIATRTKYDFEPYNHCVAIDGVAYVITSKTPITRKPYGESFKKPNVEIVLALE